MTDITQERFAEMITWAMCRMANGGGPGKCDPAHCVCGAEGEAVARSVYGNGYVLVERGEGTKAVTTPTWRADSHHYQPSEFHLNHCAICGCIQSNTIHFAEEFVRSADGRETSHVDSEATILNLIRENNRREQRLQDAEADALRLHNEKMEFFEKTLAQQIEIERLRKELEQLRAEKRTLWNDQGISGAFK
jgi:hypothetical protein